MFKVGNATEIARILDTVVDGIEEEVTDVFRGYCVALFHNLVAETPQWSGNAAANWRLSVGTPDTSEDSLLLAESKFAGKSGVVHEKGDPKALRIAAEENNGRDQDISLFTPVYISNSSQSLSGESYIMQLETNPNDFLRDVNEPGHMVERTEVTGDLGVLGPAQVQGLQRLTLGDYSNNGVL